MRETLISRRLMGFEKLKEIYKTVKKPFFA